MNKLWRLLPALFLVINIFSCKSSSNHRNKSHEDVSDESINKGREMAKMFCQSCHMLPDPSLVDAKTWEKGVLPQMDPRLGIFNYGFQTYPRSRDLDIGENFYPAHPVLPLADWQSILDYYEATSPDTLPPQQRPEPLNSGLRLFTIEEPLVNYKNSATSYLKIFPKDSSHALIIGDAVKDQLFFLNRDLTITDSVKTYGPVVDIDFNKNNMLACDIGVLNPNNGKFGKAWTINVNAKGNTPVKK